MSAKKTFACVALAAGLLAAPGVAQAVAIPTSHLSFTTNSGTWVQDADRWRGSSTGKAKICGDVVNSRTGWGSDMTIYRDIPVLPDKYLGYTVLNYSSAAQCSTLWATSTGQNYYTAHKRIKETTPHGGWVEARDS